MSIKYDMINDRERALMNIERNYQFFLKELPRLIKEHRGEFVIISDEKVIDFSPSLIEGVIYARTKYKDGEYIVQQCLPIEETMVVFHSRVGV